MANAMHDDLEEAGRHLQMVDGHLSEESMEHGEIAMTQVPVMFGDTEMEMEMETQIPEEEEDDGILVSTQVQAQIDELDEQAHVMKSFRNVLSKFALETQQGPGPGPGPGREPEQELERELEPSVSVSPKKRPTKKIVKAVKKKAAPRVQKRIKSITQFNTDKWEDIRAHDRAQKMISMLSGKSAKVKKLVSKLNCDVAADAGADQTDTDSQFAPFNESEWQHIIALLREKLPKVSRKEISSVQSYVYGKSQGLWEASQMSPEKQEQEENQEYFGTGPESAAAAGMVQDDHRLSVYTLSQLVEGHSSSNNNNSGSANQNSSDDSIQHIQNVPDVSCIDVPSSETGYASQVADSCDTGSIISLDRRSLCMGSDWEAEAESETEAETEAEIAMEIDIDIDIEKEKEKQMRAPFRTQSYDVVSSIVSPMKSTRMPSIQVPATRTTTFQDQNLVQTQTQTQLQAQNSTQVPSLKHLHTVKLIVDSNTDANEFLSSVGPMSNESDQHDSLSTVTTSMLHRDNEIIIGSEEEKDSNEYSILEVQEVPLQVPSHPRPHPRPRPLSLVSSAHPSPKIRLKTPISATDSLDSQLQPPLMTTQNSSPSTAKLRQSLRTIGLKPCKNKVQMLQVWDTLEAKFPGLSDTDGPAQLRQFLTDLIVQNRDESASLMEQIYTFEPIRFEQLKSWLVSLDSFTELIDDSFIKKWADLNGIVFRNNAESQSLSQSQTLPSQPLSQLQSPSLSP